MINILKYKIYSIFTSKPLRFLMLFGALFFLFGCEDVMDTSAGKEGNLREQIHCWQSTLTHAVLSVLDDLYHYSAEHVSYGGPTFLLLAFAIWLAFKLLRVLASFKEENLGEVWTEIFQKLFICAVCYFCVRNGQDSIDYAMKTFVLPIYQTIYELAWLNSSSMEGADSLSLGEIFGTVIFNTQSSDCTSPTTSWSMASLGYYVRTITDCMVCRINDRLNGGIQIAINLIVSMRIGAILVGIVLLLFYTAAKIFFVFFLIDSLFRINFAVYLIPVLILGIPFNYTRKWSKHGLLMFLNSSGILLFLSMLIGTATLAIESIVRGNFGYDDFEGMGINLLSICMIAILLINIPAMAVSLADKFIGGGGGMEFQKKVTKFIMNNIKKAGSSVVASVTAGTTSLITKTMEKHELTREMLSSLQEKNKSLSNAISSLGGQDDDD